jgi:hypothetical protein
MCENARNLLMHLIDREQSFRFLLHDRDRSLSLQPPDQPPTALVLAPAIHIHKREVLGGLVNEYKAAA